MRLRMPFDLVGVEHGAELADDEIETVLIKWKFERVRLPKRYVRRRDACGGHVEHGLIEIARNDPCIGQSAGEGIRHDACPRGRLQYVLGRKMCCVLRKYFRVGPKEQRHHV